MNKSSITKYIVGGIIVLAFVAYLIFSNESSMPVTGSPSPVTSQTSTSTDASTTAAGTPTPTSTGSSTATTGQYKDGAYTSNAVDAFYGQFQITVTIQGGKITDVTFPQAPSGGESSQVSARALPVLRQEAITTQSAQVAIVSGATQDSQAFQQSLAAVLVQAQG